MATTTNFGWETPDDTDLVQQGAAAMRTLGNSIDASFVDLKGGTTNQVLAKNSNTDLDFKWVADASGIPATIFDAKGDIIAATAADTADRLAVGTNGQILTADSTTATGLKWAAAPTSSLSMSEIGTGTLSGSSLSVSSLSNYDQVDFFIWNADISSDADLLFRINSNTGSNYTQGPLIQYGSTSDYTYIPSDTSFILTYNSNMGNNTTEQMCWVRFNNCKGTGFTTLNYVNYYRNASAVGYAQWGNGIYRVAETVSSIQFVVGAGSFTGGNYRVYAG